MSASVTVRDKGLKDLLNRLAKKKWALTVGVHGPEGEKTVQDSDVPTTVAEVATANEFGLGVPQRSFIRDWADQNESKNQEYLRKIAKQVVAERYNAQVGLERLGLRFVGDIQARIVAGITPPNAAVTIKRKGSSTPLINNGQLKSSITYKVTGGGLEGVAIRVDTAVRATAKRAKKAAHEAKRTLSKSSRKTVKNLAKRRKVLTKASKKTLKQAKRALRKLVKRTRRKKRTK